MSPKLRVALALSLLLMLLSTVAADAARPTPSVSVLSWTYAPVAEGSSTFDLTSSLDITMLRKYTLGIHVALKNGPCNPNTDYSCGSHYMLDTSDRKSPYSVTWQSSVSSTQTGLPYLVADPATEYDFRYGLYDSSRPGEPPVATSGWHTLVAGRVCSQVSCQVP